METAHLIAADWFESEESDEEELDEIDENVVSFVSMERILMPKMLDLFQKIATKNRIL